MINEGAGDIELSSVTIFDRLSARHAHLFHAPFDFDEQAIRVVGIWHGERLVSVDDLSGAKGTRDDKTQPHRSSGQRDTFGGAENLSVELGL